MNVNNKKGILVSGNKSKENKSKKVSWGENKITTYLNNNEIESEQNKLMNSLSKISEENSFSFQNNLNDSFNRFSIDNNVINNNNINNNVINQQNKNNILNNSNILNTNYNNNNNKNNRITLNSFNNDFLINNPINENENRNLNNSNLNNKNEENNFKKNNNNRITLNMNPLDLNQFNNENFSFDNNNNNINNININNNNNNIINNNNINQTSKISKITIIKSPNYLLDTSKSKTDKKIDLNITQNLIDINQEPNLFLSSKNSIKKNSVNNNKINNLDYSFMNNNNLEFPKSQTNSPKKFELLKERNKNNRMSITSAKRFQNKRITQDFNEMDIFNNNNSLQKTEEKKNNNENRFSFNSSIQSIKIKPLPDINNQFIEIYNKIKVKKENLLKNIEELSKEFNELLIKKNELIKLNEIIKKNVYFNTIETNKFTENIDKIKHFDKINEKIKNFFGIKVIFTNNFILNNTNYDKYSFSILLLNQIKLTFIISKNLINNKNNLINNILINNNNNNQNEKENEKIEIFEIKSKIIKKSETSNEKLLENNNENKYYNLIQSTYLNWINKFIPNNSKLTIKNIKIRMKNILKFSANYLNLIDSLNSIFIYGNEIILKYDEKNYCFNILFWIFKENGLKIKFIFSIDILDSFKGINFIGLETEDLNTKDHNLSEKFINPIYELNIKIKDYLNLKNNEKIPFFENFFTKLYEIVDKI